MNRTSSRTRASLLAAAVLVAATPALAATYVYRHALPAGPAPAAAPTQCVLPWGGVVKNGQSATAYRAPSVPYGSTCAFETRTCEGGALGGSFSHPSCSVAAPLACALPWGGILAHDGAVAAYKAASVPFGSTCEQETRSCSNGALSGSFGEKACVVEAAAACTLPWGGTLAHGQKAVAYKAATVPYGSTCEQEERTCSNGTLGGSFTSASCAVAQPAACSLPWGGTLAHNGAVTAFKAASVPFGSACEQETRTCADGTLSGSFASQSCTVAQPASCELQSVSWGVCSGTLLRTAHNGSRTVSYDGWSQTSGGYQGSASYTCSNGAWVRTSSSCNYKPGWGGGE